MNADSLFAARSYVQRCRKYRTNKNNAFLVKRCRKKTIANFYNDKGLIIGVFSQNFKLYSIRQSVQIGYTDFTEDEVRRLVEELGNQFRGDRYHLMNNNCNHFSSALTQVNTSLKQNILSFCCGYFVENV
jgi:hypothetical protein